MTTGTHGTRTHAINTDGILRRIHKPTAVRPELGLGWPECTPVAGPGQPAGPRHPTAPNGARRGAPAGRPRPTGSKAEARGGPGGPPGRAGRLSLSLSLSLYLSLDDARAVGPGSRPGPTLSLYRPRRRNHSATILSFSRHDPLFHLSFSRPVFSFSRFVRSILRRESHRTRTHALSRPHERQRTLSAASAARQACSQ